MPVRVKYARVNYQWALAPSLLVMGLLMNCAHAQQAQQPGAKRDDLDVTMQIIVDPDAKLPDEVVRRIPLPERKPAAQSTSGNGAKSTKDPAADDKDRAREAKELGRELGQSAKERAQEAKEQREQARRAEAEERKKEHPPKPPHPPGRPPRP